MGSDAQSQNTVSTNHNLFEEKGEPKRHRTEVLPLTSLTPYRWAKPALNVGQGLHGVDKSLGVLSSSLFSEFESFLSLLCVWRVTLLGYPPAPDLRLFTHTHTNTHVHAHTHTHTYTLTHTHTRTCARAPHTHKHTRARDVAKSGNTQCVYIGFISKIGSERHNLW